MSKTEAGYLKLDCVITLSELAELYDLSTSGAQYWRDNHQIASVKASGGQWLFWLPSVVEQMGQPPCPEKLSRQVAFIDILEALDRGGEGGW